MTQEKILEYNKRCAEFLGWKLVINPFNNQKSEYFYKHNGYSFIKNFEWDYRQMLFNSDWNWIMELYLKIRTVKFKLPKEEYGSYLVSKIIDGFALYFKDKSVKDVVVQAINQFLIWYNENK